MHVCGRRHGYQQALLYLYVCVNSIVMFLRGRFVGYVCNKFSDGKQKINPVFFPCFLGCAFYDTSRSAHTVFNRPRQGSHAESVRSVLLKLDQPGPIRQRGVAKHVRFDRARLALTPQKRLGHVGP